ncbi:hypothetical protein [Streptomyces sp. GbtcB6]|uniref:hypothetical protein n=1 Tax=Streptomyces sp. GbtcB6 TaxID=2824751 RepID=UPI001C2F7066|nr:hypothetical protein [Streptomyces sp. GbtcB6]
MREMTEMMAVRQGGLSRLTETPCPYKDSFADIRIDLADIALDDSGPEGAIDQIAVLVADRLVRSTNAPGAGAAMVVGLSKWFDVDQARTFHEQLFPAVWREYRERHSTLRSHSDFRFKTSVLVDGSIPLELYGNAWSFKDLHIDREVLLFSHLYGPAQDFTGGELLLVDIWPYASSHQLSFDDMFFWSDEPTEGSKPVLRPDHCDPALSECGINLGTCGPDEIVFVNNSPDAGILHGVTPVQVGDPEGYRREFHRCSVKSLRL